MNLVLDEAKTVEKPGDVHFAQVNTQLRFSGLEVGLVLNFWAWPLREGGNRRIVHTRNEIPSVPANPLRPSV